MWDPIGRWVRSSKRRRGCRVWQITGLYKLALVGCALVLVTSLLILHLVTSFTSLPRSLNLEQRCRMSRMWPNYVQYNPKSSSGLDKKYRVYLYRERAPGVIHSKGNSIPAIFVPGNAGSYGQVRSIASSSKHLFDRGEGGLHAQEIDWWSIDFNEDFSAFHGETVREEAMYLNDVISFLLERYTHVEQIPILAHSMGGIVSRLALLQNNHPNNSVATIITLSSPHAYPPIALEWGTEKMYSSLMKSRQDRRQDDVLLISVSGGILDNQLSSEASLLTLSDVWEEEKSIHSFTSSMAALWSGVDHLAMMWCDQLRERIARGVLRIEQEPDNLEMRRRKWIAMLGVEDKIIPERQALMFVNNTEIPEFMDHADIRLFPLTEGSFDKVEVTTSLNLGIDTSFGPPIDQPLEAIVQVCMQDGRCQTFSPSAFNIVPASPILAAVPSPYPRFPVPQLRYELPGNALRRLVLTAKQVREMSSSHIRILQKRGTRGKPHVSFVPAPAELRPKTLGGKLHIPFNASSSTQEAIVYGMDSTLFAYDIQIKWSDRSPSCLSLDDAPMLYVRSLSTGDSQYYPSMHNGTSYTLMLHGTSPYVQPAHQSKQGTLFRLMYDSCSQVKGITVKVNWRASSGLILSRYRTAIAAIPFAVLMFQTSFNWLEWNRNRRYPSWFVKQKTHIFPDRSKSFPPLTTSLVSHSGTLLPLMGICSFASSLVQRTLYLTKADSSTLSSSILDLSFGIPASPWNIHAILGGMLIFSGYGLALVVSCFLDLLVWLNSIVLGKLPFRRYRLIEAERSPHMDIKLPLAGLCALGLLIYLLVPIQFINLVLFLVHLTVCSLDQTRAFPIGKEQNATTQSLLNQQLLILNMQFWLLPLNTPALLVWTRNLLKGWFGTLGGDDHNVFAVMGYIAVTYIFSRRSIIPHITSR